MDSLIFLLSAALMYFHLANAEILPLSVADQQTGLDAHNEIRSDAGATAMQKLKWNDALAQFAQNAVSQCNFDHSSFEARQNIAGFPYIGENIYTITGATSQPTLQTAVHNWGSEKDAYDLAYNRCNSMCGHYTQIVWANTTDIGCAIAKCTSIEGFSGQSGYLIFCNYGIGGNMIGQKPFEKASSSADVGSKCNTEFNNSADGTGLCA